MEPPVAMYNEGTKIPTNSEYPLTTGSDCESQGMHNTPRHKY